MLPRLKSFMAMFRSLGRKAAWAALVIPALLTACSSLPDLRPTGPGFPPDVRTRCQSVFPAGPHQFVHTIEARMPDDSTAIFTGIVTLDPEKRSIRCVILTLEGFVLFDARLQQSVTVERAVPPFDSPALAENILADIRLIFFPPEKEAIATGVFDNGFSGCRYLNADGLAVDVILNPPQGWVIRQYDASDRLSRQIRAAAINTEGFPARLELSHPSMPGYRLIMMLQQSERLLPGDERLN